MMSHRYSCGAHVNDHAAELSQGTHNVTAEPRRYGALQSAPRCSTSDCIAVATWWLVVRVYGRAAGQVPYTSARRRR